jgi:hypothetical protein
MNNSNARPVQAPAADWKKAVAWKPALLVAAVVVAVVLTWQLPELFVSSRGMSQSDYWLSINQVRMSLIHFLGLAGFLIAVYIFHNIATSLQKTVSSIEESNVTTQFGQAIEHLGTYKLEVQLGGIFSLERIARQSQDVHWTVMEVLTAYLRENSQWQGSSSGNGRTESDIDLLKSGKVATDIQAIMTVIGRRNWVDIEVNNGKFLNLRRTNLSHLDLRGTDLRRANMRGVNLSGANLMDANLAGAFLGEAVLAGANLVRANLQGAHLAGADLTDANMREVNVEEANLSNTNMKGANINNTNLESAHFSSPGPVFEEDEDMETVN